MKIISQTHFHMMIQIELNLMPISSVFSVLLYSFIIKKLNKIFFNVYLGIFKHGVRSIVKKYQQ